MYEYPLIINPITTVTKLNRSNSLIYYVLTKVTQLTPSSQYIR